MKGVIFDADCGQSKYTECKGSAFLLFLCFDVNSFDFVTVCFVSFVFLLISLHLRVCVSI